MEKNFRKILGEIEQGAIKHTLTIGHVDYYMIEKTPYSFHLYAVYLRVEKKILTELKYDLRHQSYFIKRNGRDLVFSIANLDTVVPRTVGGYSYSREDDFQSVDGRDRFFGMVEVEENRGMYSAMIRLIGSIGQEVVDMSSRALIRLITEYNRLELVYKAGIDINRLGNIRSFLDIIFRAGQRNTTKLHEIFNVTRAQFRLVREIERGSFMQAIYDVRSLDSQDISKLRGFYAYIRKLEEQYNLDGRLHDFIGSRGGISFYSRAKSDANQRYRDNTFFSFVIEKSIGNPNRLIEYLLFECYVSQGLNYRNAMQEYRDYYSMSMDMGYENFDKYPKYLRTQHDIVAMNYSAVKNEVDNAVFVKATGEYKELEGRVGDYMIVVPNESVDLVTEGNVLGHCVGSYIKQVNEGRTQIMFLRLRGKESDPLVTVEVRGEEITQARGRSNRIPTQQEKQAIQTFAKRKELEVTCF